MSKLWVIKKGNEYYAHVGFGVLTTPDLTLAFIFYDSFKNKYVLGKDESWQQVEIKEVE